MMVLVHYMLMVVIAVEALHMGATVAEAGLATGIYIIGVLLARLVGGRYIELMGRKKMLYAGVIFYLLTTAVRSGLFSHRRPPWRRHQLFCPQSQLGCWCWSSVGHAATGLFQFCPYR